MALYLLLFHLAGGVALLLWAVRMVRTGVERSQEPTLRRMLRDSKTGKLRAAAVGAGVAVLLQSSTAVAVLAAGFAASGALSISTGLALMLGADLGSSLVVQILSFDLSLLVPALLIIGGLLFFKGPTREWRQGGRILIGIALILVSLAMIAEATEPLRNAEGLPAIVGYLHGDFVTAFLIGALFTWLVHSSVASILLVATLAAQGVVPVELAISLMLGANLGGGLIAVGLTRNSAVEARRIAFGNLLFRGLGSAIALVAFNLIDPSTAWLGPNAARQVVNLHLGFNVALLILCLPLTGPVATLVTKAREAEADSRAARQSAVRRRQCARPVGDRRARTGARQRHPRTPAHGRDHRADAEAPDGALRDRRSRKDQAGEAPRGGRRCRRSPTSSSISPASPTQARTTPSADTSSRALRSISSMSATPSARRC